MEHVELFAAIMFFVQITHSIEELATGFHKKWFVFKMSFKTFLTFEIVFNLFWLFVVMNKNFPFRLSLLALFIVLMFSQSLWHLAWWARVKKYIPGLITASIHTVIFLVFYFQTLLH